MHRIPGLIRTIGPKINVSILLASNNRNYACLRTIGPTSRNACAYHISDASSQSDKYISLATKNCNKTHTNA